MAEGPGYEVALKRRREGQTDYGKRLELLKSGDHRATVRVSNNHTRVQMIRYSDSGDSTVVSAFSGDLEEFGWNGHTGNLSAAYLTGFLAGYRALNEGVESAVADLGAQKREYGSRHYAALKGLQDSGLDIGASEKTFPADDRVEGAHLETSDTFEDVRNSIESEYGGE